MRPQALHRSSADALVISAPQVHICESISRGAIRSFVCKMILAADKPCHPSPTWASAAAAAAAIALDPSMSST